jgi:hypothetical protein
MIQELLQKSPGFTTKFKLSEPEIKSLKALIEQQWLERLQLVVPQYVDKFAAVGIERYHELSHLLDHGSIWSRHSRTLPPSAITKIRQMSFFKKLELELGNIIVSDEENIGWEAMHWRLVRPNQNSDVGPLHIDQWFWDLNQWPVPKNRKRFKVWISVFSEPGLSGLRIVPNSHQQDWPYQGTERHGVLKPEIQIDENQLPLELFESEPGDMIVFNYKLLHGGSISRGSLTRVSLEFTILVPE